MKQVWLLKLEIVFLSFITMFVVSSVSANDRWGGDMPFPIGTTIDLPLQDNGNIKDNNFWKVPKIDRYIKLNYLENPTKDGDLFIQLMGYKELSVIAEGVGKVEKDKILRAILKYKKQNRYVALLMGSYCADDKPPTGSKTFSVETCLDPRYMAAFEPITGSGDEKGRIKAYNMKKYDKKSYKKED